MSRYPRAIAGRGGFHLTKGMVIPPFNTRAFPQPIFDLPLKTSIIPRNGGAVPTFVRATTATFDDWENIVRTALAGEARFNGARRVQNLLTNTVFAGGNIPTGWNEIAGTGIVKATPSNIDNLHNRLDFSLSNAREIVALTVNLLAGRSYIISVFCEALTLGTLSDQSLHLVAATAVFGGTPNVATPKFVIGKRMCSGIITCTVSGTATFRVGLGCGANEAGSGSISLSHPQLEDVTLQSNQAPGEYVNVGVLTAPYQGANVDGVQYFNYQNLNSVNGNTVVTGTGAPTALPNCMYWPELARSNIVIQSEDYSTASWVDTIAGTATRANSPSLLRPGGNDCLVTTTSIGGGVRQSIAGLAAVAHTVSFFVKAGTATSVQFTLENGGAAYGTVSFFQLDLNTGAVSALTGTAPVVTAFQGGWKCSMSLGIAAGGLLANLEWRNQTNATTFILGMPQLEPSATFASKYIPTAAVLGTRNEDLFTFPIASIPGLSNVTGSAYAEFSTEWTLAPISLMAIAMVDANGRLFYTSSASPSTVIGMFDGTNVNGVNPADMSTGIRKVACSWGAAGQQMATGGGAVVTGAFDGTMSTGIGNIGIGCNPAGGSQWSGGIRNFKLFDRQLSAAQQSACTAAGFTEFAG